MVFSSDSLTQETPIISPVQILLHSPSRNPLRWDRARPPLGRRDRQYSPLRRRITPPRTLPFPRARLQSTTLRYNSRTGGLRPLCVVADFFFGWTAAVAREFGVFHAIFSGVGAFGLACFYSMWLSLPHRDSDKVEFTLPDFPEAGAFHVTQLSPSLAVADGADRFSVFQRKNLPTWANSMGSCSTL
nr:UDP-glycosyltransferase 92A1-like [Ipomoea batatas]